MQPAVGVLGNHELRVRPGGGGLAETIDHFHVSAVLHGHAHHGTYSGATPRGVPVYNCAYPVEKPSGRPYALIEV